MRSLFISISLLILLAGCTSLGNQPIYNDNGVAVNGYDVVAYFTESKAVQGNPAFTVRYNNINWLFSNEKHQQLFSSNPQQYVPQYGGYCAYAMSDGFVVDTDPNAFTVYQDKLYLNYSLSVRDNWLDNRNRFIAEADIHWQKKIRQP
ncbi:YHS domain-containing (seleno)protein [Shewanella gelidii]|uniref:YHS domain-containing protein n=1 Tax=Shewanella gelidii TaxID=1642821 RepID=A0A917N7K6_9GAMM|nr:YHS domain-containing (seleno)protein [Shewanella gelidii]MCL1097085.1 tat pathway signal sequence domain protein [Shewanella gelidii]GGI72460.1 hypothetical protein GCM10009332_07320 [Shewanella gelidii]